MQTKKGDPARGPTSEEFLHVMKDFRGEALKVAAQHPSVFTTGVRPKFSFDNPPIHNRAALATIDIKPEDRVRLPPRSPDMHKVIEHIFGTLTRAMNVSLAKDPTLNTVPKYKAELERLFKSVITPESVRKDVASLPATYDCILNDVDGGWPPANLR